MTYIYPNSISIGTWIPSDLWVIWDDLLLYILISLSFTFVGTKILLDSRYPNGTSNRTQNFVQNILMVPFNYYLLRRATYDSDIVTSYTGKQKSIQYFQYLKDWPTITFWVHPSPIEVTDQSESLRVPFAFHRLHRLHFKWNH